MVLDGNGSRFMVPDIDGKDKNNEDKLETNFKLRQGVVNISQEKG